MHYEGDIYRPPSEASSLLVQVTIGCAWNRCTFCDMYRAKRFRVRPMEEIEADLREGARYAGRFRRVFLCDGDALVLEMPKLERILTLAGQLYPGLEGVRAYASVRDVLRKTPEELQRLRELGLDMLYIGLESGSDAVLAEVNKGCTREDMITAAAKLHAAGIQQSISIISGLGGPERWREHARDTATALNEMQPEYLGMLVLTPGSDSRMHSDTATACTEPPPPRQVADEMHLLLENLELKDCFFSSAHPSNYLNVRGQLPRDRDRLIAQIERIK